MTPEKAQELRKRATPGPWERHPDNPRMLCNLDRKFAVHAELVKNRGLEPDPEDVANTELIAAAPELAEIVAGLRYEYTVQVKCDGAWVMEEDSYWGTYSVAAVRSCRTYEPSRIVRRLVGEPEVVE